MSTVLVTPAQLVAGSAACRRAGQTVDGVRRSVAGAALDTGRPASTAALDRVLTELGVALAGLGAALHGDAEALQGAADRYVTVDRTVVGP